MTTAIARWLSIAAMNAVLVTPVMAIDELAPDENVGDTFTDAASVSPAGNTPVSPAESTTAAPAANDNQINVYDDPYTFNALSRITLKQLSVDANASQPDVVKDPFQPINRKIFQFNNTLDKYILLPVAKTYKNKVPVPVRTTVGNFFSNLREPWNAVNFLLQGNGKSSYKSLGRFTVNTVTSLGLADPATRIGLASQGNEDFGQTLGKWGVKSGPFLMMPVMGPSTLRDSIGRIADIYGRPLYYAGQNSTYWSLNALEGVDARAKFVGVEDLVQGDQYALLRDLYLQRRQYLISGREQNASVDNSFGDEDASFADPAQSNGNQDSMDHDFGDTDAGDTQPTSDHSGTQPGTENHQVPDQTAGQDQDAAF